MKFMVVSERTWQPVGFGQSLIRQLAHVLDVVICYLGYLFPIWDAKRQTFADKIMSTVCVPVWALTGRNYAHVMSEQRSPADAHSWQGLATRAIHAGFRPDPATGAVNAPIYASSTFAQDGVGGLRGGYEYARTGNPTRDALEASLAAVEDGTSAGHSVRAWRPAIACCAPCCAPATT